VEEAGEVAGEAGGADESGEGAGDGEAHAGLEDEADHLAQVGAEGHTDAEFMGALANDEGHETVDPEGGEDEGGDAEGGEEAGSDALGDEGGFDEVGVSDERPDFDAAIQGSNRFAEGLCVAGGVAGGSGDDAEVQVPHALQVGDEEERSGWFVKRAVFSGFDHAHDGGGAVSEEGEFVAEGVGIGPEAARQGVVDDDDGIGGLIIGVGEVASLELGDTHGLEVAGGDDGVGGAEVFAGCSLVAFGIGPGGGAAFEPEGEPTGERGGLHTGEGQDAVLQLTVERLAGGFVVAVGAEAHAGEEEVVGFEARVDLLSLMESPEAEGGADDEDEGEGDL